MSSYSVVTAGFPGGPHTTPFRFEKPRAMELCYSPRLGGYDQHSVVGQKASSAFAGTPSAEAYVFNTQIGRLTIGRPILIAKDVTTTQHGAPTQKIASLKRIFARYYREDSQDDVALRILQIDRTTGAESVLIGYTSTDMSTTGGWGTLDEAVDLELDELTYSYGVELDISPDGNIIDARFGRVFLTFDFKGLRPGA
ncbi:MAG: hypothetical protein AAFV53_37975 [Myxococcota bacterium]